MKTKILDRVIEKDSKELGIVQGFAKSTVIVRFDDGTMGFVSEDQLQILKKESK